MERILVPYDFSDTAWNALIYACQIARKTGSEIILFHSYHAPGVDPNMPPKLTEDLIRDRNMELQERMEGKVKELPEEICSGIAVTISKKMGFITQNILHEAVEKKVQLILMGTTGTGGINKVIGSITAGVINKASIPVLAVPKDIPYKPIQKIVYASGFDPADYKFIQQLTVFADHFGAHITCLHITSPSDEKLSFKEEEIREYFWEEMALHKLDFDVIQSDDVSGELSSYIMDYEIDMLAMLTSRRHFFQRIFHPSLTRRMTMHTDVPLLAFHK